MTAPRLAWTQAALDDLLTIDAHYRREAGPATADAVLDRIVRQVEACIQFPDAARASERVPGTREGVVQRLPYIAFIHVGAECVTVLNVVHTARRFPA